MSDTVADAYLSAISALMVETRRYLEELEIIPRRTIIGDSILLALVSKSVVLTEAIVTLANQNFGDEAFGLCRSCVELQLTVRYLTNKDSVNRINRYFHFFAKDKTDWWRLISKYYPELGMSRHPDAEDIEELAAKFKSPHKWSEAPNGLKSFAEESDEFVMRDDGSPTNELFYYEILYKWMSHYVHVTEPSIDPTHATVPGDRFIVQSAKGISKRGYDAARVSFTAVLLNLIRVFRHLNLELSIDLQDKYEAVIQMRKSSRESASVKS